MASNLVFTAEKTEIGEQQSFSIRRSASDVGNIWDASLPWDSISDCIMTLTAGFATPAGQTYRGAIYQVRNIDGSHRPQSKLQWLDTDGQEYILSIFFDEIPYLVSALTELAEFEGIPLDLDATNLTEISPNNRFDVQLANALKNPETQFRKRVIALAQQNSSDVTDEVVSGWFEDLDSFTRQFLDGQYASNERVSTLTGRVASSEGDIEDLQGIVETGRLSDTVLKGTFGRRRTVDVLEHGWVIGSNDDQTSKLQAAITAAGVDGTVLLPNGLGYVDGTVSLLSGTTIQGLSGRGTLLRGRADVTMFRSVGGQAQQIRDLRIQHWQAGARTTFDIDFTNPTRPVIENVELVLAGDSSGAGGIRFRGDNPGVGENAFMPIVRNSWIRNGHILIDGVTDGMISDTWVWGPGGASNLNGTIHLRNIANGWSFVNTQVIPTQDTGSAYYIHTSWDVKINGGYIDGSFTDNMTGYGITVVNSGLLMASAFNIYACGKSGIRLVNSHGSTFNAINIYGANKSNDFHPDILVHDSNYNTFLGMIHVQPNNRTKKGRVIDVTGTSAQNTYAENSVNRALGEYYATPWFTGPIDTLGRGLKPASFWPRQSFVPNFTVPPACTGSAPAASWPSANLGIFHRFHLSDGGTFSSASVRVESGSGNIQAAIVQFDGLNWTRVAATSVTAATTGMAAISFGSIYLSPGEFALVVWVDNNTATLRVSTDEGNRTMRSTAHSTFTSAGIPASGTIGAWNSNYALRGSAVLA